MLILQLRASGILNNMKFLNNYSIKSRVLLLTLLPLTAICILAFIKTEELSLQINKLSAVDTQLQVSKKLFTTIIDLNQLRFKILHNKSQATEDVVTRLTHLTAELKSEKIKLGEDRQALLQDLQNNLEEMTEATQNITDFSSADIEDWSSYVIGDITKDALNNLEKMHIITGIESVDQKTHVINQLSWVMYYALQENWFIQVALNTKNSDYISTLQENNIAEQVFINRFISLSANDKQIKMLLDLFQTQPFINSINAKQRVLSGDLSNNRSTSAAKTHNTRLNAMLDVISNMIITTHKEISANIKSVKSSIYAFIASLFVLISLIILLGFNLSFRIFRYLKSVLSTLSIIEERNDYSITIPNDGKDEFALFSDKLNTLIAERKRNEDHIIEARQNAERANEAKTNFLANMSHEIRTPLNGILGIVQIMSESNLTANQKNNLDTMDKSSKALLLLINDILDISKIESGNLEIAPAPNCVKEIIYESLSIVLPKAIEKQINITLDYDDNIPYSLEIDAQRLQQVLINLLTNAIKFTDSGSIDVVVCGKEEKEDCFNLSISVKDSGIGIAIENQASIFKPFVQEDGSITRKFGGTGLGLSISKMLIKLMGGEISLQSEKGKGSRFYFDISCQRDDTLSQKILLPALKKSNMIIINNGVQSHLLTSNLKTLNLNIRKEIASIDCIAQDSTPKKDQISLTPADIILYFQHEENKNNNQELATLAKKFPKTPRILIQTTTSPQIEITDQIDAQVVLPLLGESFLKKLLSITKSYNESENEGAENERQEVAKKRILIAEDNMVNQKVASFFIKSFGYDFDLANNGLIAFEKIKSGEHFDGILMDCMMPEMDGFTATREIRAYQKAHNLPEIPIIAFTASVFDEDIKNCYDSGMNDYLSKPLNKELLKEKIQKHID
jgi:signal transduction histidine kinase/CheY-like chemotaxis protein